MAGLATTVVESPLVPANSRPGETHARKWGPGTRLGPQRDKEASVYYPDTEGTWPAPGCPPYPLPPLPCCLLVILDLQRQLQAAGPTPLAASSAGQNVMNFLPKGTGAEGFVLTWSVAFGKLPLL
jgi:hypothetical protein